MNEKEIKDTDKKDSSIDLSRRRLTKLGIIASPILATLPGKPAMALYKKNNCTVSGNMSGNMSENVNNVDPCASAEFGGGLMPSDWASVPTLNWPDPYKYGTGIQNPNKKFHNVFGGSSQINPSNGKSYNLLRVVRGNGHTTIPAQLDEHAVAALLNAALYSDYGYTPEQVIDLYNQYSNSIDLNEAFALLETFEYLNSKR